MPKPVKRFNVLPNPSHALDHEDEPACAVQFENARGDYWVGASIDHKKSLAEGRTCFVFDESTPVSVPATGYYRNKLESGELLPADKATADLARVEFKAPPTKPRKTPASE